MNRTENSNYNHIRGANIKDGLYSLNGPMEQKYIFTDNKLGTNPSKEKLQLDFMTLPVLPCPATRPMKKQCMSNILDMLKILHNI